CFFIFFQAEDGIRDFHVTGVQTRALPISVGSTKTTSVSSASAAPSIGASSTGTACQGLLAEVFRADTPSSMFSWVSASLMVSLRSEERRVGKERNTNVCIYVSWTERSTYV